MNLSEMDSSVLCWERDEELDDHDGGDEAEQFAELVDDDDDDVDEDDPEPDEDLPSVLCVTPMI